MSASIAPRALSSQPLFTTTDPDQISDYMSEVFRPNLSRLRNRSCHADFCHRRVSLASSSINNVRYGREAFVEAPPINEVYLGMYTLAGAAEVKQGHDTFVTRPGTFCVLNPTQHLHFHLSEDFEQLTIKLCSDTVRRALFEVTEFDPRRPLEFVPQNVATTGAAASFGHLVNSICEDMSRPASGFVNPTVSRHLEQALANLLVTTFPHSYSDQLRQSVQAPAPYFVKRAEEYMRANLCSPIELAAVAEATGVSVRSLQSGFRRFRDTTPTAYLRNQRLELVRQKLLEAAGSDTRIIDIALACGFTHLSKFAQHYKSRFGESPAETKRGFTI